MTKVVQLAKGLAALAVLAGLVVGVPWALWHFIGWPLPHHLPSAGQVGRALNRQGIPAQTLVDALAVVVWLTWATLVASLAVEIPAALSGRHAPHLPVAGIFQPVTGRLVAAIIVACLTLAPRPAHPGSGGGSAGAVGLPARRPVAALVIRNATLTAATTTTPTVDSNNEAEAPTAPAPMSAPAIYTVQRGDTLWGIAQKQLGDPLRWSEIYQLNVGRPQPGGVTLDDPHWIDPGWTLLLPAATSSTPPTTSTPSPAPAPPMTATSNPSAPAPATPSTTAPTATPTTSPATAAPSAHHNGTVPHREVSSSQPVRLPSGSEVAASFAAGVLATVAIGRLRRRHAYRYRPPRPGRDLSPVPPRPTLRHLSQAARPDEPNEAPAAPEVVPVFPVDDDARRLDPGWLEIGTRNGVPVAVEVTDLSGLALIGPVVDDVARALVAALLVRAVPGATEILLTTDTADRLLPGLAADRALRRVDDSDHMARAVEAERIARTRRMAGVDASDAATFRHDNPENPLPLLLVLLGQVPTESHGRWAALLADASHLGIALIFLGSSPLATSRLTLDASATATGVEGDGGVRDLAGMSLYQLRADEATELLGAVNDANDEADDDSDPDGTYGSVTPLRGDPGWPTEKAADVAWPEVPDLGGDEDRAIVVDMLGPLRIIVHGQTITSGLRGRAQALFAWYLLRPEGATSDEAVDALWPDTEPDQVRRQFWRPFGDLRSRLRSTGDNSLEVLEKTGEHYRPNPAEIACDLWRFQAALAEAARADDDDTARIALRRAVETYRGDLLSGIGYSWVEPVRQDLHRRALDAHLRLAELDERAGHPDLAVEVLERVIDLDRYAEEPYRRLMALHAAHGRPDAVTATFQLLRARLADLDVDMDEITARLYRTLTTDTPLTPRSVRLSS
ncbi:MAG: LysM peptidoglycan-binding domain-containing protein [Acidimicrobiales bacterium]|nr:LysM peptidoglycan-binding domain-containing protein [Acidimicrobiales bacterium]